MKEFKKLATETVRRLGPETLRSVVDRLESGWADPAITAVVPPRAAAATAELLALLAADYIDRSAALAFLNGLAAGYEAATESVTVDTVWTGPSSAAVPVRATAEALLDVIDEAQIELSLMTFSAREHPAIRAALQRAVARRVRVDVAVETVAGARGLLRLPEPAAAFAGIPGLTIWHWNPIVRPDASAHLHAKLAVADRCLLLVSSANLTAAGVTSNIEAGLLVRGGMAPQRVAEHLEALRARQVLVVLAAN